MPMEWHVKEVGSYWLEPEDTLEVTKFNESKSKTVLPQNKLDRKQMLLVPYFLTHDHLVELTET